MARPWDPCRYLDQSQGFACGSFTAWILGSSPRMTTVVCGMPHFSQVAQPTICYPRQTYARPGAHMPQAFVLLWRSRISRSRIRPGTAQRMRLGMFSALSLSPRTQAQPEIRGLLVCREVQLRNGRAAGPCHITPELQQADLRVGPGSPLCFVRDDVRAGVSPARSSRPKDKRAAR